MKDNCFTQKTKSQIIENIENNKNIFLGVATLLIVLYHLPRYFGFFKVFDPCFIGVDFFLFFSGFSLCYSITKNSLKDFYKRRFFRIYPMYFILAVVITALASLKFSSFSLIGWLCNITTLSYYKVGGCFVDWYLSSIFYFYLLFPLLFRITHKRGLIVPITISIIVCLIISFYDIDWWYGCAIGRLPIFSLGLFLFVDNSKNKKYFLFCSAFYFVLFVISVILYKIGAYMRGYFLTDMITPTILLFFAVVLCILPTFSEGKIGSFIAKIGTYSLEIYVANVITMKSIILINEYFYCNCHIMCLVLYFLLNISIAFILIKINSIIKRLFIFHK